MELERGRMGGVGTWEDGWSWNVGGWVQLERGRMGGVGTWEDGCSWNVGGWVELQWSDDSSRSCGGHSAPGPMMQCFLLSADNSLLVDVHILLVILSVHGI